MELAPKPSSGLRRILLRLINPSSLVVAVEGTLVRNRLHGQIERLAVLRPVPLLIALSPALLAVLSGARWFGRFQSHFLFHSGVGGPLLFSLFNPSSDGLGRVQLDAGAFDQWSVDESRLISCLNKVLEDST